MPAFDSEVFDQVIRLLRDLHGSLSEITRETGTNDPAGIVARSLLLQVKPVVNLSSQGFSWNQSKRLVRQIQLALNETAINYGILLWDPQLDDAPPIPELSQDAEWVSLSESSNDEDSELLSTKKLSW